MSQQSTDDDDEELKRARPQWGKHAPIISVKPDADHPGAWLLALPAPWNTNPTVAIYMVPRDATFKVHDAQAPEYAGCKGAFAHFKRNEEEYIIPLQLIDRDYGNWVQQKKVIAAMAGKIHPTAYTGPLGDIPMKCMIHDDYMPIAILWDKPHQTMLHLRETFSNLTKRIGING